MLGLKSNKKIKSNKYKSYSDYVEHQKSKLNVIKNAWLPEYDVKFRKALVKRLKKQGIVKPGMNVLCLAARIGTEVKAFIDLGCFAVGLDLNPGEHNKYVIEGDFHNIQFADNSVDVVFSNSLDHVLDINKLVGEIKRVLKPKGIFVMELNYGVDEGFKPGNWEVTTWKKIDDVVALLNKNNFVVLKKDKFDYPWEGQHISLKLKSK